MATALSVGLVGHRTGDAAMRAASKQRTSDDPIGGTYAGFSSVGIRTVETVANLPEDELVGGSFPAGIDGMKPQPSTNL